MQQFRIVPTIKVIDSCKEFCETMNVGVKDLILTNPTYFEGYLDAYVDGAKVVYFKTYGSGEPTDVMVEALYKDICQYDFDRVIAIGGGSIIDVAKLIVQEKVLPLENLFDTKDTKKVKRLVIVPTTCGTGSEVTSVSVINMTCKGSKIGLQTDEEFADEAVLIPELLENLPQKFFATSSIDALIHAIESFLSPRASVFSEMFSKEAIRMILTGYIAIRDKGESARKEQLKNILIASTYAGIAFGNAGCAAVHAMSMPFSGAYHVPHGEANYVIFTGVFRAYNRIKPDGKINILNQLLSEILGCDKAKVYDELELLLNTILQKKTLSEYGVKKAEIPDYVENVETKQGRLTANNYVPLSTEEMLKIYESLY